MPILCFVHIAISNSLTGQFQWRTHMHRYNCQNSYVGNYIRFKTWEIRNSLTCPAIHIMSSCIFTIRMNLMNHKLLLTDLSLSYLSSSHLISFASISSTSACSSCQNYNALVDILLQQKLSEPKIFLWKSRKSSG